MSTLQTQDPEAPGDKPVQTFFAAARKKLGGFAHTIPLLAAVIALLVTFQIWVEQPFVTKDNMLNLAQQISINAILAFGMTLVILLGGIDLSVGRVLALVGTTTGYLLCQHSATSQNVAMLVLAIGIGLAVAVAFGLFHGLCAAKTRMPPFIITLGSMMIAQGAALRFNEGQPMTIPEVNTAFLSIGNGRLAGGLPVSVLIMLVVFAAMTVLLHRTRFGQHLYAMGGNREAARFTGIPLVRIEVVVYVLCALLAGIAGLIHTSQLYAAEPASGAGFELNAIAAVVVGGTSFTGGIGTMYGTLIGAVIIGILDKGLNMAGVHFSFQYIVKGLVILVAVYIDVMRRK